MYRTIVEAMQLLADDGSNAPKSESELQFALGNRLEQLTEADGWKWRFGHSEERFKTTALDNEEVIQIDLVGRHPTKGTVAIELKYVPAPPKNAPAFAWDVAKDCLRLDLLRAGYCTPADKSVALPDPANLQTYAIAVTDWPHYWAGQKPMGWATNFVKAIRDTPVRFEGLIQTTGGNPENTIFAQGRCHIAFGRPWVGEWRPYNTANQAQEFRYLLVHPESGATPRWPDLEELSVEEQCAVYPFLRRESRGGWRKRNSAFDESEKRRRQVKRGAAQSGRIKVALQLDQDVLTLLQSYGPDWPDQINEILRQAIRKP